MSNSGTVAGRSNRRSWRNRIAGAVTLASAFAGLTALAGFAARLGWIFELASHFRAQCVWGLLIGAVALFVGRRYRSALAAAALVAMLIGSLRSFYVSDNGQKPGPPNLRVLSLNVHSGNRRHADVLRFIRETSPDVAVFLEVNDPWAEALLALKEEWPYSLSQPRPGNFGIAIFSRKPLLTKRMEYLSEQCPAVAAQIDVEGMPVWIFGAHPYPPMTPGMAARRDGQLAALAGIVNVVDGEKVVVGDMNTTSWSPVFTDVSRRTGLRDSREGFGVQPTWQAGWLPVLRIPIDHCLVSNGIQVTGRAIGPDVGSDHLPVIVDLAVGSRQSP